MIEYLNSIDTELLLNINSLHTPYLDGLMYLISDKWIWIPLYALIILALVQKNWRQAVFIIILTALAITLADQISSGIIKHAVERFRPTHEPAIADMVYVVNGYRGGRFGFVSSHAANTVAFALLFSLLFRNRWFSVTIFLWAAIVMYSRMYLGVHYPGDILGGIIVGLLCGYFCYLLYCYVVKLATLNGKFPWLKAQSWNFPVIIKQTAKAISVVIIAMCLIITILPFFML